MKGYKGKEEKYYKNNYSSEDQKQKKRGERAMAIKSN
jgi:hypothetical protein